MQNASGWTNCFLIRSDINIQLPLENIRNHLFIRQISWAPPLLLWVLSHVVVSEDHKSFYNLNL